MKHKMRISIWLATIAVIVFILLMTLTVNRVREKDVVDQFSLQQLALARGTAARIETLLGNVEKNLTMLSLLPSVRMVTPDETVSSMKVIHEHLEGKVRFIARLDERGILRSVYPDRTFAGLRGERFDRYAFFSPDPQNEGSLRRRTGPFRRHPAVPNSPDESRCRDRRAQVPVWNPEPLHRSGFRDHAPGDDDRLLREGAQGKAGAGFLDRRSPGAADRPSGGGIHRAQRERPRKEG
jgi:hypothetical protein